MFTNTKGDKYEGKWINDQKHGYGIYYYPSGGIYKGNWVKGKKSGLGSYTWSNGTILKAIWKDGEPNSQGELILTGFQNVLLGEYKNGVIYNGSGMYIYDYGGRYIGEWKNGKFVE